MEFKGTKGPWRVINGWNKNGEGKFFPSVVLFGSDDDGSLGRNRITINVSHNQEVESLMANALLISKSPILLQAIYDSIQELKEAGLTAMAEYHEKLYFECVNL